MERISVDENSKHHRLMQAVVHLRGQSRGDGNILPATPNATNAMYGERERGDIHLVGEPVISFYALLCGENYCIIELFSCKIADERLKSYVLDLFI